MAIPIGPTAGPRSDGPPTNPRSTTGSASRSAASPSTRKPGVHTGIPNATSSRSGSGAVERFRRVTPVTPRPPTTSLHRGRATGSTTPRSCVASVGRRCRHGGTSRATARDGAPRAPGVRPVTAGRGPATAMRTAPPAVGRPPTTMPARRVGRRSTRGVVATGIGTSSEPPPKPDGRCPFGSVKRTHGDVRNAGRWGSLVSFGLRVAVTAVRICAGPLLPHFNPVSDVLRPSGGRNRILASGASEGRQVAARAAKRAGTSCCGSTSAPAHFPRNPKRGTTATSPGCGCVAHTEIRSREWSDRRERNDRGSTSAPAHTAGNSSASSSHQTIERGGFDREHPRSPLRPSRRRREPTPRGRRRASRRAEEVDRRQDVRTMSTSALASAPGPPRPQFDAPTRASSGRPRAAERADQAALTGSRTGTSPRTPHRRQ